MSLAHDQSAACDTLTPASLGQFHVGVNTPARSGSGLWGHVAWLLHKPDRLLAKNRTTYLLPTRNRLVLDMTMQMHYHMGHSEFGVLNACHP
jgi:hypothetical protein